LATMPGREGRGTVRDACDRFEREALPLLEEGQPLPSHFASCPDCQKAREVYERLTRALSAQGAPPENQKWEVGVWSAIESRERQRPAWKKRWIAAAAAAVVVLGVAGTVKLQNMRHDHVQEVEGS